MDAKTFALNAIKPYYKDHSLCGWDGEKCVYLTEYGNRCVAGKFMNEDFIKSDKILNCNGDQKSISSILGDYSQDEVFVPKATGILSTKQWIWLQAVHDSISQRMNNLQFYIYKLGLFTMEELQAD